MPRISVDNLEPDISPKVKKTVVKSSGNNVKEEKMEEAVKIGDANGQTDAILKEKSGGKLSAFMAFPDGVRFQGEDDGEKIVLLLRKHIITNVPWVLVTSILWLMPVFIFPLLFLANVIPPLPIGFRFVFMIFWYLATFTYALLNFLNWYFNVYILTEERVIDIDWYSLIYRRVTTAQMSKIQDVSNIIGGVIRSTFDFGTVHIETAGEFENIEFEDVPHPALVADKLVELMALEEKEWEVKP